MSDPEGKTGGHAAELIARDRERILGSVSVAVSGQTAAIVAGLLCMVLTTRLLGPGGYGRLAMFFLFLEVLSQIVGWPNLGLVRFGREELAQAGRIAGTFWARVTLFFGGLAVAAALLFAFRRPVGEYLGIEYPPHILLLFYVGLNELVFLLRGVFQTVGKFRWYAVATGGVRAFNFLFILLAFVILQWPASPGGIVWAQLASIAVVAGLCALFLPWPQLLPVRLSGPSVRRVFDYSWPVILVGFSALVVNWIDLVVIKHYRSADEVGLYAVAYQPVTMLTALQAAAVAAVLPLVVSLAIEKKRDALRWYVDEGLPQAAWLIGLAFTVIAAAGEAIPLVFGARYQASVAPCQVLMAGLSFSVLAALQTVPAQALDRVRAVAVACMVLALVNLALDLLLVPRVGILGASIATAVAFAVGSLLLFPVLNSTHDLRGPHAWRRYSSLLGLHPVVIFAVLAVVFTQPWHRLVLAGALLLLWLFLAKASGVFRMSTLERMRTVRMPAWTFRAMQGFYQVLARQGSR